VPEGDTLRLDGVNGTIAVAGGQALLVRVQRR